jgi:RNA polymerase sigma factor (sigma-70 family)
VVSNPAEAKVLERERQLIETAQRGDVNALRPLLETYSAPLYERVIMPRVGNPTIAEDVLRDTLVTAVIQIKRFRWQGHSFFSWLRQIAINKAYDAHRASRRRQRVLEEMATEYSACADPAPPADTALIADQERTITRRRIDRTLAQLSERYRTAIVLRLVEELPREECAAQLNLSIGAFDVLFFRAVRAFRARYLQDPEDYDGR